MLRIINKSDICCFSGLICYLPEVAYTELLAVDGDGTHPWT